MRPIWKGTISFGLVSIPVSLYPATRREELRFRLLRGSDLSPVNYKRVAEADGKEVPWDKIVKGYEHEKGKYVVLKEEDFARVDVEATQTVEIVQFVSLEEVNPLLFYKPYYMQAEKGGEKAYVLLREALADAGKIGIAKVVIKTRQHLAALKPQHRGIMLELMRFPEELLDGSDFKLPKPQKVSSAEQNMARKLVDSMTQNWNPTAFKDDYRDLLEKVIEEKMKHPQKSVGKREPKRPHGNLIDLASMLQQSVEAAKRKPRPAKAGGRKKAA
jgi:DNA end-binding protein Ku